MLGYAPVVQGRGSPVGDDDDVRPGQPVLMEPVELPDASFYPVSLDRAAYLAADGQTKASSRPVRQDEHFELLTSNRPSAARRPAELGRFEQTLGPGKGMFFPPGQGLVGYAERRLRPLARRRLSTARPPADAILARNPCLLLRLIRLGWNVLFMVRSHLSCGFR